MRHGVAHEMHPAALPRGAQHLGDGGLKTLVRVGDHQLDPAQATAGQGTEELRPEGLCLAVADRHAEHLAATIGVGADRDDHRHGHDVPVPPGFHVGGVQPHVGPVPLDRAGQKSLHPLVDLGAQPGHLALADAVHPHGPHQVVHRASGDALHVGLLDDGRQRLLRRPARLQEAWEVGTLAQPRDAQLHRARPRMPVALAVAVPLHLPIGTALAVRSTGQRLGFQFHQPLGRKADHLAQERGIGSFRQQLAQGSLVVGHRGVLGSVLRLATQPYPGSPR